MKSELIDRMREALDMMDPVTRTVFERARLDEKDYARIAGELDITIEGVERRFAEALLQIWRHLDRAERP